MTTYSCWGCVIAMALVFAAVILVLSPLMEGKAHKQEKEPHG